MDPKLILKGSRGTYKGSMLSVFRSYIMVFVSFYQFFINIITCRVVDLQLSDALRKNPKYLVNILKNEVAKVLLFDLLDLNSSQ